MASEDSDAKSYPLRIIGAIDSAVMFFEDAPTSFGYELGGISALDMENRKIIRQVDYWDGRQAPLANTRVPDSQYRADLGEPGVQKASNPVFQGIVDRLHAALSLDDSSAAAALFYTDAVWEDRTTRTLIGGWLATERYLARASSSLPYGIGATVIIMFTNCHPAW